MAFPCGIYLNMIYLKTKQTTVTDREGVSDERTRLQVCVPRDRRHSVDRCVYLFVRAHSPFHSNDYAARQAAEAAIRWLPSCVIGAILSAAASLVVVRLLKDIDEK